MATYDASGVYASQTATAMWNRMAADSIVTWSFVLSANTTVVFTANGNVNSHGDAYGNADLFAHSLSDGSGYLQDQILMGNGDHQIRQLSLSFSSAQDGLTGIAGMSAGGSAEQLTPVPEPETYAMLLAGLGLVGAVARRRKARA